MKSIELAIQLEEQYFLDVINGIEPRPELLNYISQAGYENVEEFHNDKKEYNYSLLSFRDWELTSDEITYHLSEICEDISSRKENCIFYNIDMNQLSAFVPSNFNKEELAKELNIQPIYGKYNSNEGKGIIITGDQDLKFAISCPKIYNGIGNYLANKIVIFFKQYYNNVIFTGNDILIDNKKIIGFASREISDVFVSMFNVNFHNYMFYIDKMCKYDKIPGYIDNENITARTVLKEIKSWLHLY